MGELGESGISRRVPFFTTEKTGPPHHHVWSPGTKPPQVHIAKPPGLTRIYLPTVDCWDGPDGEPIVHHGYTLTSKILFKDVIETINKYAFIKNE